LGTITCASCAPSASRSTVTAAYWWRGPWPSRGLAAGHLRQDGSIEPHATTEERLLELTGAGTDLFRDRAARLADAYRRRARAVAARLKA
jgi:hypothetical protein